MSEVMNDAGSPVTEAELLGIIGRQQESIFHADRLIAMLLRKLGGRAVLKPHEIALVSTQAVETSGDDDGNSVLSLVDVVPEVVQ